MRIFFLLLLLANVAFFAWTRFVGAGSGIDPAPLARQIEPEKLRVVSPEELAKVPAAKPPAPPAAAAPAAAAPAATVASAPVATPPAPAPTLKCVAWGGFAPADAARAKQSLEPLALGDRLAERKAEESAAWWVYIPPPPARAGNPRQAALRKGGELKKLGVQDYFIVQEESAARWAISLGVFRTEEAAQARLAALHAQGVRSARVGPREARAAKIWLEVKGADPALEKSLRERARNFPDTELRDCMP